MSALTDAPHFAGTRTALARYDNLAETRALLDKMADRAAADGAYGPGFRDWLAHGGTLELRVLAEPFGDFWNDRHNFNVLTAIDSAHLHRFDPLPDA